jgi:hypothetical protein
MIPYQSARRVAGLRSVRERSFSNSLAVHPGSVASTAGSISAPRRRVILGTVERYPMAVLAGLQPKPLARLLGQKDSHQHTGHELVGERTSSAEIGVITKAQRDRVLLCERVELSVVTSQRTAQRGAKTVELYQIGATEPTRGAGVVRGEPSKHLGSVSPTIGTGLEVLRVEHAPNQFERFWCLSITWPVAIGENQAHAVLRVLVHRHGC